MRRIMAVLFLGLGVVAAASLFFRSEPVAAALSNPRRCLMRKKIETAGRVPALGLHRCAFDA
jgi:hypothetical protein